MNTAVKYTKTWTTQDGRELPVHKMSDEHIANAIRMCRRRGFTGEFPSVPSFSGEMAQMAAEHELDVMMTHYMPVLGWLEAEAERRGIEV